MMRSTAVLMSTALFLAGCGAVDDNPADVRIGSGIARGVHDGEIIRWRGLPYAAPPTGDRRWQAPQSPASWNGVRVASASGPACAQMPRKPSASEDCLYLDVTAPAGGKKKPVMVWLHGGGFSEGAGRDYDPARLTAQGDVVVVTVEFRLGIFGFFGMPNLADSGTYGFQDQQAALRWVRDNIAGFGGDPDNVTLFGESGGAIGTCAQLTSPSAAGLFHRAILQSGSCSLRGLDGNLPPDNPGFDFFRPLADVARDGAAAGGKLGCADVACLRRLPTEAFDEAYAGFGAGVYDTGLLPEEPRQALRAGRFVRVPVLTGFTADEHRFTLGLMAMAGYRITATEHPELIRANFGDRAEEVLRRYPASRYAGDGGLAWAATYTDAMWACPILFDRAALARHVATWAYEFADPQAQPFIDLPADPPPGASHASELPNLFEVAGRKPISSDRYTDAQRKLAERMVGHWTAFARTGDPGWTRDGVQRLAPTGDEPIDGPATHQCDFWAS